MCLVAKDGYPPLPGETGLIVRPILNRLGVNVRDVAHAPKEGRVALLSARLTCLPSLRFSGTRWEPFDPMP